MSDHITRSILSHTNEVCSNIIPKMENSLLNNLSSTVKIEDYTVTITITKKTVLGKRRYDMTENDYYPEARNTIPKFDTCDKLLYNTLGHNFLDMYS